MKAAETIVRQFLAHLENRDLDAAERLLASDIEMIFPGGARFKRLEELLLWARPRYRRIAKRIARMDTASCGEGDIVICQGELLGEWPDGQQFEGIRFADWFLIRDGLIRKQHVWNDLAEIMAEKPADQP